MKISRETLIFEANRSGFRAEILEKVMRLTDLLNAFANDDFLKTRIALKGGTALNLFHFDLPRLSVDIDLNYIGSLERDMMLSEKPKILEKIANICEDKKYSSIRQPSEHAGGKWSLNYKSELVLNGRLELDLNFISRAPLWQIDHLDSISIGSYQAKSIPVLDFYDLVGGKLTALFSRHKSRDLFDAYTIFKNAKNLDQSKIKLAFIVYAAASRMDIRKISLDHIDFDANELKNMLLPVLRQEKIKEATDIQSWSKKIINGCKAHLGEIIKFSSKELAFLTNIIEHGEITPKLITKDEKLTNLISKHPVLLWKCEHVKTFINKNNLNVSQNNLENKPENKLIQYDLKILETVFKSDEIKLLTHPDWQLVTEMKSSPFVDRLKSLDEIRQNTITTAKENPEKSQRLYKIMVNELKRILHRPYYKELLSEKMPTFGKFVQDQGKNLGLTITKGKDISF